MNFSNPQKAVKKAENYVLDGIPAIHADGFQSDYICEFFTSKGIPCRAQGGIDITCEHDSSRSMTYIEETRRLTNEKYILETSVPDGKPLIKITASSRRGVRDAVNAIYRQIQSGSLFVGVTQDYPLFHKRGYIEGFYGNPWSFEERTDMLKLMSEHGMNTYFYAPKDDPYHRDRWDELYPEHELEKLKTLIAFSQKRCIDFHFCIAPGLSMRYTSEDDYLKLLNKIKQLYFAGVRHFGLLLDDIPEKLHYEEDIEHFGGETVNAHIYLINRVFDDLKDIDSSMKLVICPLQYHGRGDEYFISKLGTSIEPQVDIFWTGRNICSQELTVPEAARFTDSTNHRPLYWDNFPVNDAEMFNEMHLGYINGRDKELYKFSQGIISNCMEYCECSKIPLLTIADYLHNPLKYNHNASWDYAIKTVLGSLSEDFKPFAENLMTSCLKVSNSQMMCSTMSKAGQQILCGNNENALKMMGGYIDKINRTRELLKRNDIKLFRELKRWIEKFNCMCDAYNSCYEFLVTGSQTARKSAEKNLNKYISLPEVFADFCFQQTVSFVINLK